MSFFGVNVNPFSTPVGQRIEQATDGNLPSENWTLNMEICDIINETEDGPRDAIKAIKRRLNQAAGKNYTIVMYTLTVLETCVKNCGKRFHTLACTREFIQELVKLIGPKNEPPTIVQEKVLSLIQTWADTFRNQPHCQGVVQVHQELKAKGMQFPATDLDSMAPIITPERSCPEVKPTSNVPVSDQVATAAAAAATTAMPQHPQQLRQMANQPRKLTEEQLAKLQSELDVVQGNIRVLTEMLNYLTTADNQMDHEPDSADMELLTEVHSTCKAIQERIVDLIGQLDNDDLTAELLRFNDELNNLFLRYSRFTKNKNVTASSILAQTIGHASNDESTSQASQDLDSLIDLSDGTDSLDQRFGATSISGDFEKSKQERKTKGDTDEFDMFAQSRKASYETAKTSKHDDNPEEKKESNLNPTMLNRLSTRQMNSGTIASGNTDSTPDFEKEDWFKFIPTTQTDQSLTSSEFERFLAERSAATETVPKTTFGTTTTTTTSTSSSVSRPINKEQDEKSLFAL